MSNSINKKVLNKHPYLKDFAKYTIFTTEEDFKSIRSSETILIGETFVYTEFLRRILTDQTYYSYAQKFFTGKIKEFWVSYVIHGDLGPKIKYSISDISKALIEYVKMKPDEIYANEWARYEKLLSASSFDIFLEKHINDIYNVNIDGIEYSISVYHILNLMALDDGTFRNLCFNNSVREIEGIPKEHFIYACYRYFKDHNVFSLYIFPPNMEKRFNQIRSFRYLDLESINTFLETEDKKFLEINLNPELVHAIIGDIDENFSDLEKAIYIYIKMCKLLTYDEEYYALGQGGNAKIKHQDIKYVESISLENNAVVCFEFNIIYSKLLNQLGIHFKSTYKNMVGEAYGEAHANLKFRCGKFLIGADSVTSILSGDMVRVKMNQPLEGLKCFNKHLETQDEFNGIVKRIYSLVKEQSDGKIDKKYIVTFDEILEEYEKLTPNIKEVSLQEKFSILLSRVKKSKLTGISVLSYVKELKKIIFSSSELDNNFKLLIIRHNIDGNVKPCIIFVINNNGFDSNPKSNIYYYLNSSYDLYPLSKSQIEENFKTGEFEYIFWDDPKIPGIRERMRR